MIEKLKLLIDDWKEEEQYLNGPDDSSYDRAVGQAYGKCAKLLEDVVAAHPVKNYGSPTCGVHKTPLEYMGEGAWRCPDCDGTKEYGFARRFCHACGRDLRTAQPVQEDVVSMRCWNCGGFFTNTSGVCPQCKNQV